MADDIHTIQDDSDGEDEQILSDGDGDDDNDWTQGLDSRPASRFRLRFAKARVMRHETGEVPVASPKARQLVDASGVSHIGRVISWTLDLPLLLAFVERW